MNYLLDIIHNPLFVSAALGWAIAQLIKAILYAIVNKEFRFERLLGNGGMPSSHSATVCALATSTAINYGCAGFEFAMVSFFAIIVMIDAMGVRLETGKQAVIINDMLEMFKEMGKWSSEKRLKEFVGHTPLQILVGAILGILIAIVYNGYFLG